PPESRELHTPAPSYQRHKGPSSSLGIQSRTAWTITGTSANLTSTSCGNHAPERRTSTMTSPVPSTHSHLSLARSSAVGRGGAVAAKMDAATQVGIDILAR